MPEVPRSAVSTAQMATKWGSFRTTAPPRSHTSGPLPHAHRALVVGRWQKDPLPLLRLAQEPPRAHTSTPCGSPPAPHPGLTDSPSFQGRRHNRRLHGSPGTAAPGPLSCRTWKELPPRGSGPTPPLLPPPLPRPPALHPLLSPHKGFLQSLVTLPVRGVPRLGWEQGGVGKPGQEGCEDPLMSWFSVAVPRSSGHEGSGMGGLRLCPGVLWGISVGLSPQSSVLGRLVDAGEECEDDRFRPELGTHRRASPGPPAPHWLEAVAGVRAPAGGQASPGPPR